MLFDVDDNISVLSIVSWFLCICFFSNFFYLFVYCLRLYWIGDGLDLYSYLDVVDDG